MFRNVEGVKTESFLCADLQQGVERQWHSFLGQRQCAVECCWRSYSSQCWPPPEGGGEREGGRKGEREGEREGGREGEKEEREERRRRMVGGKESSDREQEGKVELVCFSFP